ncbi:high-affinity Zn(2+) transporter zrt1 [Gryganskiella cystojenkinii]|nr:high-affinity Zn(2+) transporter zrt1 [Gryganskiella cystojenkinii]
MLPTAMGNLSSPCLGEVFSEQYTAFGGLFVMLSSLFMHWIEFVAVEHNERRMREAAASQGLENINIDLGGLGATGVAAAPCPGHTVTIVEERPCHDSCSSVSSCDFDHSAGQPASRVDSTDSSITRNISHISSGEHKGEELDYQPHHHHHHHEHEHEHEEDHDHDHDQVDHKHGHEQGHEQGHGHGHDRRGREHDQKSEANRSHHHHTQEIGHSHSHGLSLLDDSQRRISTYILEAGIAAHSVIIGISLGVSTGSEFMGLLVALIFHQFFEGFALGARIADLAFETKYTHYLLALFFSLTTPIGVGIGIGISNTYNPNSKTSLLVVGIFDSISTGILLYMGYVNLLAVEFNLSGELRKESKKVKSMCFIALWTGAAIMAIIGRFA